MRVKDKIHNINFDGSFKTKNMVKYYNRERKQITISFIPRIFHSWLKRLVYMLSILLINDLDIIYRFQLVVGLRDYNLQISDTSSCSPLEG